MTRKLTIRTKLAAALAVPLVALATFAAFQVRGAYNRADQVKRQAALATAASRPEGVLSALESERDYESLWAIGAQDLVDPALQTSGDATSRSNAALSDFRRQVATVGGDAAGDYQATLSSVAGNLTAVRKYAQQHASKVQSPATAQTANKIFDDYTAIIQQVIEVDQRSGTAISDPAMRNGAELLNAISRQNNIEKQIVAKAMLATIANNPATAAQVQQLVGAQQAAADSIAVLAQGQFTSAVTPTLTSKARTDVADALTAATKDPRHVNPEKLFATSATATKLWRVPQTNVASIVTARAQHLTVAAQEDQRNWMIVMIASILLAITMLWLANKWITKPLRQLAEQAASMAGERLPAAVQEILDTPLAEEVATPEVEPVRVKAGGEVREVADALNRVQDSAIELAVEQAQLRGNVADAFVNLGRRNQNLLSRQLEFITQLENSESDPETLEHLFRLDHLATRMRRNAESLLVLAGHEPPRTWAAPVDIGDVVRGALGEVEGYQRVRLRHLDDAEVDGASAVDVSHVVAELVENALSFSPPESDVDIYGRSDEYGYVLTIVDHGIGMTAEDLERANALISNADARTFAPSRFLGHYVVAQLARRHAMSVSLTASPDSGLTALIALPGPLVGLEEVAPPLDLPEVEPVPIADDGAIERPAAALPRRGAALDDIELDDEEEPVAPVPLALVPDPEPEAEAEPTLEWQSFDAPPAEPPSHSMPPTPSAPDGIGTGAAAAAGAGIAFGAAFASELLSKNSDDAAPDPTVDAPAPEPVALAAPEPEPEPVPEPVAEAPVVEAPPAPPKPRIGVGSFADLRATPAPRVAPPQPEAEAPASPVEQPAAAQAPPAAPTMPSPDRAAAFAEVAGAVDAAVTAPADPAAPGEPAYSFSEELLPQKLPKRGRKAAKMGTPWKRERPAQAITPTPAVAPYTPPAASELASLAAAAPAASPSPAPAPAPAPVNSDGNGLHFPPGGPAMAAQPSGQAPAPTPEGAPRANTEEDRFAFFAAFRAAAEQAREEAGIDDRKVGQ